MASDRKARAAPKKRREELRTVKYRRFWGRIIVMLAPFCNGRITFVRGVVNRPSDWAEMRSGWREFSCSHTVFALPPEFAFSFCLRTHGKRISTGRRNELYHCPDAQMVACARSHSAQAPFLTPPNLDTEPHKYFDHVVITLRSGDGGHGAVLKMPRPRPEMAATVSKKNKKEKNKRRPSFKRNSDGSLILPMGGNGGDVVIFADQNTDSLLEFHRKKRYNAKRGSNVDAMGYITPLIHDGASAPTLRIPVPVGTVVKKKRGGKLLADLSHPGDEVLVARGGRGGISLVEILESNKACLQSGKAPVMKDPEDKVLILGLPGEEVALELILRVVADVGLVGLPNAGKSSLLAAVTRAKPEIAEYPFTTLMPNLGCLEGDPETEDGGFSFGPIMADLPGLIKGAHLGKGLGRMFLRHLKRTRLVVHVVDASTEDPVQDYIILREELLMYNPDYLKRPHIVVLNKLDIPEAKERFESFQQKILKIGLHVGEPSKTLVGKPFLDNSLKTGTSSSSEQLNNLVTPLQATTEEGSAYPLKEDRDLCVYPRPTAVIGTSALHGLGMENLLGEIRLVLQNDSKA